MRWQVESGKLPEQFTRLGVIRSGRVLCGAIATERHSLLSVLDVRLKSPVGFDADSLESASTRRAWLRFVGVVLRRGAETEIRTAIVERVSVDVVHLHSLGGIKQDAMQIDGRGSGLRVSTFDGSPYVPDATAAWIPLGLPPMAGDELNVRFVDQDRLAGRNGDNTKRGRLWSHSGAPIARCHAGGSRKLRSGTSLPPQFYTNTRTSDRSHGLHMLASERARYAQKGAA